MFTGHGIFGISKGNYVLKWEDCAGNLCSFPYYQDPSVKADNRSVYVQNPSTLEYIEEPVESHGSSFSK